MGQKRNRWQLALVAFLGVFCIAASGVASLASADSPASGSGDVTVSQKDRAAVLALWAKQFDAWAAGDGRTYADLFTADGEMVVFDGTHVAGRENIATYMQFVFDNFLQHTRLSAFVESMRMVAPQTIVMISHGCVLRPGETVCPPPADSRQTNVFVKQRGQWWFSSFQNTRINPAF